MTRSFHAAGGDVFVDAEGRDANGTQRTTAENNSPPETPAERPENHSGEAGPLSWVLDDVIRRHVADCLLCCNGDRIATAKALGVGQTTLYRWLKKWGVR